MTARAAVLSQVVEAVAKDLAAAPWWFPPFLFALGVLGAGGVTAVAVRAIALGAW